MSLWVNIFSPAQIRTLWIMLTHSQWKLNFTTRSAGPWPVTSDKPHSSRLQEGKKEQWPTWAINRSQSPKREPSVTDSQHCQAHKPHPKKSPEAGYHLGSCCFPLSLNYLLLLLLLGLLHQELGTLCLLLGCREKGHRHWKYIVSSIRTWQLRPGALLPKEPVTFPEHIEVQNIPGGTLPSLE